MTLGRGNAVTLGRGDAGTRRLGAGRRGDGMKRGNGESPRRRVSVSPCLPFPASPVPRVSLAASA